MSSLLKGPIRRKVVVTLWHTLGVVIAYYLAFLIRFDFIIPANYVDTYLRTIPFTLGNFLIMFHLFRLHRVLWVYFSIDDLQRTGTAIFAGTLTNAVMIYFIQGNTFANYPRSAFVSSIVFLLMWETGWRFILRSIRYRAQFEEDQNKADRRTIVIGDSEQADVLLLRRQLLKASIGEIVGVVTNDETQQDLTMHGLRIRGPIENIGEIASQLHTNTLVILPPYTQPQEIRTILDACSASQISPEYRVIPSLEDLAAGHIDVPTIRKVAIEDLLNRKPASFDRAVISNYLRGKSVMITGAGGSIGAEITRQVAKHQPTHLLLFEISEFSLYSIEREISQRHPDINVIPYTGDVRRLPDIEDAISLADNIDTIYHTAAYKHVPLMEKNISSCIQNNVIGSHNIATAAHQHGIQRMVLISSDKAVRPTSIMGASKRLAEHAILQQPESQTSYVAVRFGNVLGSSGSVIPLFKKQIAVGGPVTVTTENSRRYFMTIPEAVELVLMAGIVGKDRQVMVLEMGEPVKIANLARRLIELSGFVPEKDIPIEYIGLRPGEKEYEELMTADENVVETDTDKIWFLQRDRDYEESIDIERIQQLVERKDQQGLRSLIAHLISESYFATDDLPRQEKITTTEC